MRLCFHLLPLTVLLLISCGQPNVPLDESRDGLRLIDHPNDPYVGCNIGGEEVLGPGVSALRVWRNYLIFEKTADDVPSGIEVYPNSGTYGYDQAARSRLVFETAVEFAFPYGIYDHYLFVDYGTAPGIRGLTIHDLETGETIFDGAYNGRSVELTGDFFFTVGQFNGERRPSEDGMFSVSSLHLYSINLETRAVTDLDRIEDVLSN